MGLTSSRDQTLDRPAASKSNHVGQPSTRNRTKPPMPDRDELEARFIKVLASMELPLDKAKLLRNYDLEKKWEIICDQDMVQAKDSPAHYLNMLKTYLDPGASRSYRKRKMVGDSTSTQVLRDLEISLRTNHIEWVQEFLNEQNRGLDVLIDYLSFRLTMMMQEQRIQANDGISQANTTSSECLVTSDANSSASWRRRARSTETEDPISSPGIVRRRSRHAARLKMGASTDDIHVCIMCMRAIMNNKYGFNMVIQHREAINSIALSLVHHSLRTKALVLELLAAICLVKGGHQTKILSAFDNFKKVVGEPRRFHTLMEYFMNYDSFHIEFMVACVQFVNVIVHSVEDMNFRVHLQYEFTALQLDNYLERLLRHCESEELQVQISAYLDNVMTCDVAALMEDSETKAAALERVTELEEELAHAHERLAGLEREAVGKLATLESELAQARLERDQLAEARRQVVEEVSTLRRAQQDSRNRQSMLESKVQELESLTKTLPKGVSMGAISSHLTTNGLTTNGPTTNTTSNSTTNINTNGILPTTNGHHTPTPTPTTNGTVKPPPPPPMFNLCPVAAPPPPPPPPAPGNMPVPIHTDAMTIKRKIETKYKLPTLNWVPLRPNQVRGTIFNELDEERPWPRLNFTEFEEMFRIGGANAGSLDQGVADSLASFPSKRFKKPDTVSLLDHTRLRNVAISRRRLNTPAEKLIATVNNLDLKQMPLESVEVLQRMVPTEQEQKAYKEYIASKKPINILTEEDKFLLQLAKVERISAKLSIMNYMGNFYDNVQLITPQVHAIISGSSSVKSSHKLKSVLEIVLAVGNYLNSIKRGPAYGFKLQSLDSLKDIKSTDKRVSLLHYIVATIRQNFPELMNFDADFLYIEKAAQVSLEELVGDVTELERGMEAVKREAEHRGGSSGAQIVLKDFLNNAADKLRRLRQETKHAQDSYAQCVEYFAEAPRSCDPNAFFSLLVRFTRAFKEADKENEQRRRLELAAAQADDPNDPKKAKLVQKKHQDAVINELKSKSQGVGEKKLLQQDEVYNGALEDILNGLRSEPYRRPDAVRRSFRRRINSHRLSKGLDE